MKKIILALFIMLTLLLCSCGKDEHRFKKGDIVCTRLTGVKVLILGLRGTSTYNIKYATKDGSIYSNSLTDFELEECPNENIKEYQQHEETKKSL